MKKLLKIFIPILIFMFCMLPNIVRAEEETQTRVDYSVTILPGEGSIQKNLEECKKANAYNRYTYIYCDPDQFEEIDSINVTVRENENIKNRIDYTRHFWNIEEILLPDWAKDSYITDTKIVKEILKNGIDTFYYGTSCKYSENDDKFGDLAYSTECERIYLFVPPEGKYFSHFVDQDGNTFNIGDTVTKNLILTPLYDEEEPEVTVMGKKIYNVTFAKGEGQIYYKAEWRYNNNKDGPIDNFTFQSFDGESNFFEASSTYAKFKYSDYEKGIIALEERKKICS